LTKRIQNNEPSKKTFDFCHKVHGDVHLSVKEMAEKFELDISTLAKVSKRKISYHKGWCLKSTMNKKVSITI
jgi:hypothetical protein|tara:strand:- start:2791 stop:3006 length:216 start_codon:yes stop_codon:yes gene_type:complete